MKTMMKVFLSFVAFLMIGMTNCIGVFAATENSDGMTVVAELVDEKLNLTISGIKIVEKDQMLAYSLVSEDTAEGILYANAKYVNGQTVMMEGISISGEELTEEKLKNCVLTVQNMAGEQQVIIRFAPEETEMPTPEEEEASEPEEEASEPEETETPAPEETPTPAPEEDDEEVLTESTPTEAPLLAASTDTGDKSNIYISICMLMVSLVVMGSLVLIYKKKQHTEEL